MENCKVFVKEVTDGADLKKKKKKLNPKAKIKITKNQSDILILSENLSRAQELMALGTLKVQIKVGPKIAD